MIHRTEVEDMEAELRELQVQVPELQESIRVQNDKMADLGSRTPRPEWHSQRRMLPECEQHIVPISRQACKPTAVVAAKLVRRLSHYASQLDVRSLMLGLQRHKCVAPAVRILCMCVQETARDRDHLQMMLAPDPHGWRATLGSGCDGDGGKEVFVQARGCGGDVPRVLRAKGQVLAPLRRHVGDHARSNSEQLLVFHRSYNSSPRAGLCSRSRWQRVDQDALGTAEAVAATVQLCAWRAL